MSLLRTAIWIGFSLYALSWFLPVVRGTGMTKAIPGWSAFLVALAAPWQAADGDLGAWPNALIASATALTNVLMAAVLMATARGAGVRPRWAWSLIAAGILNAWWLAMVGRDLRELAAGYYIWWLSFFAVGIAAVAGSRATARPVAPASRADPSPSR